MESVKNLEKEMTKGQKFPSKLLLFGEYSVFAGSGAVALPLPHFYGQFSHNEQMAQQQKDQLQPFFEYLKKINARRNFLDIAQMEEALRRGYYLKSNIPTGCGLGSSGVLSAALLSAFGRGKNKDLNSVRKDLQMIEAYFHGRSSGLDPLVSYYGQKIALINDHVEVLSELPTTSPLPFRVFIYNSNTKRNTSQLVAVFQELMREEEYSTQFKDTYIPEVKHGIRSFLTGNVDALFEGLKNISKLQLQLFKPMIPDAIYSIWKRGTENNLYFFKLCGAGGGGYFFIFSKGEKPLSDREGLLDVTSSLFSDFTDQ